MSQSNPPISRRTIFAGAATAGALGAAAALLGRTPGVDAPLVEKLPPPENGGGYQLSDHVKKYYKSTRL